MRLHKYIQLMKLNSEGGGEGSAACVSLFNSAAPLDHQRPASPELQQGLIASLSLPPSPPAAPPPLPPFVISLEGERGRGEREREHLKMSVVVVEI